MRALQRCGSSSGSSIHVTGLASCSGLDTRLACFMQVLPGVAQRSAGRARQAHSPCRPGQLLQFRFAHAMFKHVSTVPGVVSICRSRDAPKPALQTCRQSSSAFRMPFSSTYTGRCRAVDRGCCRVAAPWDPPPVSETKRKFRETYPKPISGIYDAVVQELLVQQHLIRYNKRYSYNPVSCNTFAAGCMHL